jgi:hypothetical protein
MNLAGTDDIVAGEIFSLVAVLSHICVLAAFAHPAWLNEDQFRNLKRT